MIHDVIHGDLCICPSCCPGQMVARRREVIPRAVSLTQRTEPDKFVSVTFVIT